MPDKEFDVNSAVQNDVKTLSNLRTTGRPGFLRALELFCGSIALLVVIIMITSMPWVGQGKAIPGQVWIGYSLSGILIFGGLMFVFRYMRQHGNQLDNQVSRKFEQGR